MQRMKRMETAQHKVVFLSSHIWREYTPTYECIKYILMQNLQTNNLLKILESLNYLFLGNGRSIWF